jgi:hypothetical protein
MNSLYHWAPEADPRILLAHWWLKEEAAGLPEGGYREIRTLTAKLAGGHRSQALCQEGSE